MSSIKKEKALKTNLTRQQVGILLLVGYLVLATGSLILSISIGGSFILIAPITLVLGSVLSGPVAGKVNSDIKGTETEGEIAFAMSLFALGGIIIISLG